MTLDEAIAALANAAEEWRCGMDAWDVVLAACEVLVAGHDGMAVATLAGVERMEAEEKLPGFIVDALAEVGVPFFLPGSDAEQVAWLAPIAGRLLRGELSPRELAMAAYDAIDDSACPETSGLVALGWEYVKVDERDAEAWDPAEIDAAVLAEAERLNERR